MAFRELLKGYSEEIVRSDKAYCELELSDGNNIYIEKRNGKYVMNCTKACFSLSKDEMFELTSMMKTIK